MKPPCKLLGGVNLFRNRIHEIHDRLGGSIEVALFDKTVTNPQAHIDLALKRFHERAPEVEIKLRCHAHARDSARSDR